MAAVQIYFITNRNYDPDNENSPFGAYLDPGSPDPKGYNPDGVAALRFGHATFEVAGDKATMQECYVYPDPRVLKSRNTVPAVGSGNFLDDLRKDMLGGRDALVFIHGFNVSFLDALTAGALLASTLPDTLKLIVFSWPSDGLAIPYMSYYSDREDARASGPALARAYLKLFDFVKDLREAEVAAAEEAGADSPPPSRVLCDRCIHVLAHSMGNYLLRNGIQAIRVKEPLKMVRMFDQVIMAAPDEDDDTFECDDKLRVLPTMARRITVYHNRRDRALVISDKTKANPDRLGSEGPRMLDLLPKKVIIVDCARIAGPADPLIFHSYYIHSRSIAKDISAVLADKEDDKIGNREEIRVGRAYRIKA